MSPVAGRMPLQFFNAASGCFVTEAESGGIPPRVTGEKRMARISSPVAQPALFFRNQAGCTLKCRMACFSMGGFSTGHGGQDALSQPPVPEQDN